MDDLFWEEFETDFDEYAERRQSSATVEELQAEKQFAEELLGR